MQRIQRSTQQGARRPESESIMKTQIEVNGKALYVYTSNLKSDPVPEGAVQLSCKEALAKQFDELERNPQNEADGWRHGDVVQMIRYNAEGAKVLQCIEIRTKQMQAYMDYRSLWVEIEHKATAFPKMAKETQELVARASLTGLLYEMTKSLKALAYQRAYSRVWERMLDDDFDLSRVPLQEQREAAPEYLKHLRDRMEGVYKYFLDATLHAWTASSTSQIDNVLDNAARDGQQAAVYELGRMIGAIK